MTRRSRIAVVVVALAACWLVVRWRAASEAAAREVPAHAAAVARAATPGLADAVARARARPARIPFAATYDGDAVTITGRVLDLRSQQPVASVEVVFRSGAGEASATTRGDGSYAIQIAPGMYHAFVRDDTVLSVGRTDFARVPGPPTADTAGVPDDALMTIVLATRDTEGVDLSVVRGGIVAGHVVDRAGHAIAGAVLRASGSGFRPVLGTDVTETERDGSFELRLPAGAFALDVNHPRFAGVAAITGSPAAGAGGAQVRLVVAPGDHLQTTITLTAGCVIAGRVVRHDGRAAGDGAIERQWGSGDDDFTPAGRIEADGTFRWVTTEASEVAIRAWPWKSPPSGSQRFTCRDGARFDHVVLELTERPPAIAGVLLDATGARVAGAYIDVQPLDPGGIGQQERSDAAGTWEVYNLPPGRYRVVAQADGRGIAMTTLTAPVTGVALALGGTGRLEGTTPHLAHGSFEIVLGTCIDDNRLIALPESQRLVSVTDGHYAIDGLPACELAFRVLWHGRQTAERAVIPGGGTATLPLDLEALGGRPADMPGDIVREPAVSDDEPGDDEGEASDAAPGGARPIDVETDLETIDPPIAPVRREPLPRRPSGVIVE